MLFQNLYELVEERLVSPPVSFDFLRNLVNAYHGGFGEIKVWAVTYPEPNHQAHFIHFGYSRTSAYEEPYKEAEIRYCDALDEHPRDRRYALTKELMHVFDTDDEMTNTREKFIELLKEIQNQPLPEHASGMFKSELDTRWMAAIILCPRKFRDEYVLQYQNNKIENFEIAETFHIPEWVVPFIMDDYYERAFEQLMKKGT